MTLGEFAARVAAGLPYKPNGQQSLLIEALARFCSPAQYDAGARDRVFMLNGYAGTGKTSIVGALVKALAEVRIATELLAPTGRAAKVFGAYAGTPAHTIHRRIYRHSLHGETPGLRDNNCRDTIFIVDEASMIAGDDGAAASVLTDLIHFVYGAPGCRMILVGDTAQLPPVGSDFSQAMDAGVLRGYGLAVTRVTLTETARQQAFSGILANATWQRRAMRAEKIPLPRIFTDDYDDVNVVTPEDLFEAIDTAYREDGVAQTIVITRSNRRAVDFNRAIRNEVLYNEEAVCQGELLMVAKNNYFWSRRVKGLGFVANGDIVVVERVHGTETRYGMSFADVTLTLSDRDVSFDAKIMLDTLQSDAAAVPAEKMRTLYEALMTDPDLFPLGMPFDERARALRDNPYWNALQVKYAYAVTCHKAQGGQWKHVVVDMLSIAPEAVGVEFYRWLYTATTRARTTLTFVCSEQED